MYAGTVLHGWKSQVEVVMPCSRLCREPAGKIARVIYQIRTRPWVSSRCMGVKLKREKSALSFAAMPARNNAAKNTEAAKLVAVLQSNAAQFDKAKACQRLSLIGDKQAVRILFDEIAPRFADRQGGYTRVLRLAKPRLGDAGTRAILELVGKNDRIRKKAAKPSFDSDVSQPETAVAPPAPEASAPAAE